MRKITTLILAMLMVTLSGKLKASDTVPVDINLDVNHIVGDVDSFDRQKFITIHASPTENDWKQAGMNIDDIDYIFNELDVYFGRDNGRLGWEVSNTSEDPARSGYASPTSVESRGAKFVSDYNSSVNAFWRRYDSQNDVMMGGQVSSLWENGNSWDWAGADAAGEYLGHWVSNAYRDTNDNNIANGMPLNRFVELLNEPLYHFVDDANVAEEEKEDPITIFRYHRDAAKAFKRVNTSGAKFGGYTAAFPYFTDDEFQRWDDRMKLFMDTAGADMDFYSIHIYDFNKHHDGVHRHFKGSRVEATFDLIENYSMIIEDNVKPFVISEYGGRDLKEEYKTWSADRDWKYLKAFTPLLMSFMDRPDIVLKTIPFIPANYYWAMDYGSTNPYPWRLFRRTGEPSDPDSGEYVFTDLIKFYELWNDVKGKRIDTWSKNPDILVDGYVDGSKAYIILSNVGFEQETIKLNLNGLNGNSISNVMLKHLHAIDGLASLDTSNSASLNSFTLDSEASAVIIYTFDTDVSIDKNTIETRYYGDKVKQAIIANTPVNFNINDVITDTYGSATLRVSFGRADSLAKKPVVIVNNDTLPVPDNFSGDDVVSSYPWFYGLLEIPVPYDLLSTNNTVTVKFPDAGGYISAITMKVFNNDREINRSDSAESINVYPSSINLGIDQYRQLTATIAPVYAADKRVTWSSSDISKVTVDANGKVKGIATGNAVITATSADGGFESTCNVTIEATRVPVLVDTIIVTPSTAELIETNTLQLSYEVLPVDADNKTIIWATSNSNASVDNGLVTAEAHGTVAIKAMGANGKIGECSLSIIEKVPGSIFLVDEVNYAIIQEGTSLNVECTYTTSTGVTASSMRMSLDLIDTDSTFINGYVAYDNSVNGTTTGTAIATIGSRRATASADLPAGQYYVLNIRMTESDGNEVIKSIRVIVGDDTGINDYNTNSATIYPVPAKDQITIISNVDFTIINFYDLTGSLQYASTISEGSVNISNLPDGIYLTELLGDNNERTITKVVIQK